MAQPSNLLSHCDTFFKKGKTNLPGLCALLRLLLQRHHKIFIHGKISLIPASRVTCRDGFHAPGLKSAQTCNPNLECKGFRSSSLHSAAPPRLLHQEEHREKRLRHLILRGRTKQSMSAPSPAGESLFFSFFFCNHLFAAQISFNSSLNTRTKKLWMWCLAPPLWRRGTCQHWPDMTGFFNTLAQWWIGFITHTFSEVPKWKKQNNWSRWLKTIIRSKLQVIFL